ncbi:hypothetical protein RJ639_033396 [Escallonia herrerae]|uniref:Uncharacterized protein n=1 Tax=Escallonia herrerae TaxID=1293975 RepID=A0AA89BBL8_9ASTE|nr:hypothetical protein RJ639_033396 [Escallonia herrerae]
MVIVLAGRWGFVVGGFGCRWCCRGRVVVGILVVIVDVGGAGRGELLVVMNVVLEVLVAVNDGVCGAALVESATAMQCINLSPAVNGQQNTARELNALSAQWKELCEENIEILAACAKIGNYIEELKREAMERHELDTSEVRWFKQIYVPNICAYDHSLIDSASQEVAAGICIDSF